VKKDEYVRVLDYLPRGKSDVPPHKRKPMAQAIGEKYFSLLEITPKPGMTFESGERAYIGDGVREKVDHIERRIKYEWLTPTAKSEVEGILEKIIMEHEQVYVSFYNSAGSLSTRLHKLEVLPRIGKRHRDEIVAERTTMPFKSFEDMAQRLKTVPDPVKIIADKIIEELKGESKYYLFVLLLHDREFAR
jgi:putative nucleotide binding protein